MSDPSPPLRPARIPLRAAATAVGVFALLAQFTDAWGLASAVLAAFCGVVVGEALAYGRLRTGPALALAVGTALVGALAARFVVHMTWISQLLSPQNALLLASVVGFGLATLGLTAALRLTARRIAGLQVLELGAFALATVTAFAAHRDGALARPLWLTDRAWQLGIDPASVLLAIGALAAVTIAMLQLLESRHRLPWFSWLWLPAVALAAFLLADVTTAERPTSAELDAIQSTMDRPPEASSQSGEEDSDSSEGTSGARPEDGEEGKAGEASEEGQQVEVSPGDEGPEVEVSPGEEGPEVEVSPGEEGPEVEAAPGEEGPEIEASPGEEGPQVEAQPEEGDGVASADPNGDDDPGEQGGQPQDPGEEGGQPQDPGEEGGQPQDPGEEGEQPQGEGKEGEAGEEPQDPQEEEASEESSEPVSQEESEDESEADRPPPEEQPDLEDEPNASSPSNRPVAVVILGDDYSPISGYFYLRQEVASEFAGTRLVPTVRTDVDLDVHKTFVAGPTEVTEPPPEEGRKVVHGKVAITAEHTAPFALEGVLSMEPAYNPNPARFLRAWEFVSLVPIAAYEELVGKTSGSQMEPDVLAHYLEFPSEDPRYQRLVDELIAELPVEAQPDPFARALAIKQHLDQMAYDTSERHAEASDPTAEFLFDGDEMVGYCVHSAHASVYLLRAAGVPARVATGYAVEEERRRGSSLVVLSKDAHAWPELYLDGVGWTILDVSPAENRDPAGQPMDEEMADLLADMAREEPETEQTAGIDWRSIWHATLRTLSNAAILLIAVIVVLHYMIKLWRRSRPFVASQRGISRVGYRAALDRLTEAGIVRQEGETRERFARRAAQAAPSFAELTDLHLAASLGRPGDSAPRSTSTWLRLLRSFHRELSGTTGWRRWLGVINPFSFYRSR